MAKVVIPIDDEKEMTVECHDSHGISDGVFTFGELYAIADLLLVAFVNQYAVAQALQKQIDGTPIKPIGYKTWHYHDGDLVDEHGFLVVVLIEGCLIPFVLNKVLWTKVDLPQRDRADNPEQPTTPNKIAAHLAKWIGLKPEDLVNE